MCFFFLHQLHLALEVSALSVTTLLFSTVEPSDLSEAVGRLDTRDQETYTMRTLLSIWLHVLAYVRLLLLATDVLASIKDVNQEKWEKDIRSASSLDELLMLTDFPDWKLWRCRLKLKHTDSSSFPESRSASVVSHRFTRFAANSYSLEVLKAIDEEWQKTQCMPRETYVDVAQELGTSNDMFFKPPCVSVFRCSGCCNKEGVMCRNTSTTYVDKIVLSVVPFKYGPEPMLIRVANHTECKCQEPQMIRRHALPHRKRGCFPIRQAEDSRRLCDQGLIWDCMEDRCVPYPSSKQEFPSNTKADDCEIDIEKCECIPKELTSTRKNPCSCAGRRRQFNHTSCSCKKK
ncbi:vascular endothelial growth factor D isoform X2 [Clarias gariepinus]|uniref:vascular endothelial growth factor D isoform X2 n=1 Tax=Clarias gariepinus TaxID=13013 RepID=UPI00234C1D02|nr:vascular endothelial growth factor D isoform X2 [Clarias gariepinus]